MDARAPSTPTVGSLFAGIGGFDLGFEQAGFGTAWQVEINPVSRAVLADRFPHAKQFIDVRTCLPDLWRPGGIDAAGRAGKLLLSALPKMSKDR